MGEIIFKKFFGALALFMGVTILAWWVYNQFHPTPDFKSGGYLSILQLGVPIAMLFVGWDWIRYQGKGIEDMFPYDFQCEELDQAAVQVRETLPLFISAAKEKVEGAYVRFPLQTPNARSYDCWAYVQSFDEGSFNVTLGDKSKPSAPGQEGRHYVSPSEVKDWRIEHPDGRVEGAYTFIALFRHWEKSGKSLSPRMKKQKAALVDFM